MSSAGTTNPGFRELINRKTFRLNGAYMLTTFGDRMWMFAIGIFMHKLGGMTWVAVQQFFDALIKLVFLPLIGSLMDKKDRNTIMQISLLINNIAVAISSSAFCLCFYLISQNGEMGYGLFVFIAAILMASFSRLASEAQRICFTKDWIVVITRTYPEEGVTLTDQNSLMSVIDQSSSIVLPIITGYMFSYLGWTISCIFIIIYNVASWYAESNILRNLYNMTPELKNREGNEENEESIVQSISWSQSLRLYFKQSSWMAGFGLTLLYMTVLGFDNLSGSYGQKHGLSISDLGILRAIGSLMGVLGAITYGKITPKIGLLWATFFGLTWQNIFIYLSGVSTLLPDSPMNVTGFANSFEVNRWMFDIVHQVGSPANADAQIVPFFQLPVSILLFFLGISLARFGLWIADPAITQIQQETIPETQRYTVFAMQTAFCETFSLLKDFLVILFPYTELFGALAIMSCIFVLSGYILNNIYFIKCGGSRKDAHHRKGTMQEMHTIAPKEKDSLLEPNITVKTP